MDALAVLGLEPAGWQSGVAIPAGLAPPLDREIKYARLDSNQRPWD